MQYCPNTCKTTLHRSKPYVMLSEAVQCCLNTPGTSLQCCRGHQLSRGPRQHCTGKNCVQCYLNTLGTTLHRSKPSEILSERLQITFHRKNLVHYCLNTPGTTLQLGPSGKKEQKVILPLLSKSVNYLTKDSSSLAFYPATGQTSSWILYKQVKVLVNYAMLPKPMQSSLVVSLKWWQDQGCISH